MKNSHSVYLLVTILVSCHISLIAADSTAVEHSGLPNIILVMADDQGYGDAGFTGHPILKTPNMDAMAKNAIVFNRFYASSPVCSPTRASIMTGRHSMRVNVPDHGHYMRPDEYTIAEFLKEAGYLTGHFGKWHIGSVQKISPTSPGGAGFDEWLSGLNYFDLNPYLSDNGTYKQIKGQGTVITMDATIEFLKKHQHAGKPLFAVSWFPAPHWPFDETPTGDVKPYEGKHEKYYREIQVIDQQLGRLRKTLRDLKMAEDTIVWYCSDNGGLVEETSGGRDKKRSMYEGGLRVPSIVEWPAKWKGREIDVPAFTSDMFPTLKAIVQAKKQMPQKKTPKMDGIDLRAIIAGKEIARPPMGFWFFFTGGQSTYSDRTIKQLMEAQQAGKPNPHPKRIYKNVREFPKHPKGVFTGHGVWNDWPWKLHRIEKDKKVTIELYNLIEDPMEASDVSAKELERVARMRQALEIWQSSVLDSHEGKDYK